MTLLELLNIITVNTSLEIKNIDGIIYRGSAQGLYQLLEAETEFSKIADSEIISLGINHNDLILLVDWLSKEINETTTRLVFSFNGGIKSWVIKK